MTERWGALLDPRVTLTLIALFVLITAPSVMALPMLDGNIDFLQVYDVYTKGLGGYIAEWGTVHPPLKMLLGSIAFQIAGFHWITYHLTGVIIGAIGLMLYMKLVRVLASPAVATLSTVFLIASGLYVANTPGWPTDLLVAIAAYGALLAYTQKQIVPLCAWCVVASLIKETGVIMGVSIGIHTALRITIQVAKGRHIRQLDIWYLTAGLLSLATLFAWQVTLRLSGGEVWSEWNFSSTAEKGTLYTIAANILSLNFLNEYLRQHLLQLLVLNYHWVYASILGAVAISRMMSVLQTGRKAAGHRAKEAVSSPWGVIALFTIIYSVSVLGFQTYTIPRYGLPIQWVFYLLLALAIAYLVKLHKPAGILVCGATVVLMISSLYTSRDPVSIMVWGTKDVLGQRIYDLPSYRAGNDGITYNAQYLNVLARRTQVIELAQQQRDEVRAPSCEYIFPDPNNERRTLSLLGFSEKVAKATCVKAAPVQSARSAD